MQIKITKEDIFYCVTNISSYDALEKIIDPSRYELYPDSIWDKVKGKLIKQDEDYAYYYSQIRDLKEFAPKMQISEIRRLCEEIEQIAPKQINV